MVASINDASGFWNKAIRAAPELAVLHECEGDLAQFSAEHELLLPKAVAAAAVAAVQHD